MNTFAPVFQKILDSSVWTEPYHVRVLWTAMLTLKDSDHVVRYNAFQLYRKANLESEEEALDALRILQAPDRKRIEKQAHDGRRIQKVEDGWLILNGQIYEDEMRKVSRRFYKARKERERRERIRASNPLPGEAKFLQMERNGEDTSKEPGNKIPL